MTNSSKPSDPFQGVINRYIEDSTPHFTKPKRPPAGAPNVVYIVLDDTGYSHLGCFGSDISTPNIDSLAADGLRYTNFHTTAICSPTRACLLTGRNHHSVGMGTLADFEKGFPNARGKVTNETALLSEVLKQEGYSTFAVGKWHLVPASERSVVGPFDSWPLAKGFERYYGFLGGETSQWNPTLVSGNEYIDQPRKAEEGYHLTEDLTDTAIRYIREQKSTAPNKPFFLYLAYGATHAPHHAPKEFIDKYAGKYDQGWDVTREKWFARQKELGIIPQDTVLPPRNPGIQAWDALSATEQRLFARMQEAFAGFLDHTDYHIGRLIEALKKINQYENTIIVLVSDNGASPEGMQVGTWNEWKNFNGKAETAEEEIKFIDKIGTPQAYNHYPMGWAQAGNTPLKWYKTFVHAGGVKDPLIITYPNRIQDAGGTRGQYHHAIDVMPTVLELAGIEAPSVVAGIAQKPIEGVSLTYSFDHNEEPSLRTTQYFEMLGNRAIYHKGWKAVTRHIPGSSFDSDQWELYQVENDFSETNNLAAAEPEKLQQLIDLWWEEAEKYGVLPLDGRPLFGRNGREGNPETTTFKYYPNPGGFHYEQHKDISNRSYSIEADLDRSSEDQEGCILAYCGRFGGLALFVQHNRLQFAYNYIGEQQYVVASDKQLPLGPIRVRFDFESNGNHAGEGKLYVNGQLAGQGIIAKTAPFVIGPGAYSIGKSDSTPVVESYEAPFIFTGELHEVKLTIHNYIRDFDVEAAVELAAD